MVELIVYLEPSKETTLYQCLSDFLNKSKEIYYPSTAIKYPPHTSVTGFFTIQDRERVLPFIIDKYEKCIKKSNQILINDPIVPKVDTTPLLVTKPPPPSSTLSSYQQYHLLLPVKISSSLYALLTECAKDINHTLLSNYHHQENKVEGEGKNTLIRSKNIDHISLAYWDEPHATEEETKNWLTWAEKNMPSIQQDIINQLKNIHVTKKWDIVLYERVYKSHIIGKPHLFNELARWHIYK